MQVRDGWKQRVSAKQGTVAVLVVIVLLGGMGVVSIREGHLPPIPSAFYGMLLATVWGPALWNWWQFGKRAFPFWRVVYLIGFSAFAGGNLLAPGVALREWIINIGTLAVLVVLGVSIFRPRSNVQTPHDTGL